MTAKERNVVEQSIAILKMAQVSDFEIFPNSHGQVLASLRPGLWHISWVGDGSFANGLINDKKLFLSHMDEYDIVLRIKGNRPGYIRLNSSDPYENQEWVFINLRIALAHLLFGEKAEAFRMLNFVTEQAAVNNNTIPEMYSSKLQMERVTGDFKSSNIWCNCIRDNDDQYIGTIPMVGYGSAAYILTLYAYYAE